MRRVMHFEFKKSQLGMSLVEMLVVLGLTSLLIMALVDMMQLQSMSDKRDSMENDVASLKKNLIANIDCEATFENFVGTCDGTQSVLLYKSDILGARPLTGTLIPDSNASFKGSGSYGEFYVKATCGDQNTLLIDAALPAKFNPPIGFKNDPTSLKKSSSGTTYTKKLDFNHPLLNGLLSLSDGLCSTPNDVVDETIDGYSRFSVSNQTLMQSIDTINSDLVRTPIYNSVYTAKGEKLSIHFQSHILSGLDNHTLLAEGLRIRNAEMTAFMRINVNGVTLVNEPVASFDFFEGTVRSRIDIERQVDCLPGDTVTSTIEMQVTNFGTPTVVDLDDSAFIINSKGFLTIEDFEK